MNPIAILLCIGAAAGVLVFALDVWLAPTVKTLTPEEEGFISCVLRECERDVKTPMATIMGRWPGDETDDEIDEALKQIS